ncbi:glycosyltransferase [Candidatus Woesearchaeota archaeon]|nr:glycosyltransferase [Candidatus Woesearchaeota archaeon]
MLSIIIPTLNEEKYLPKLLDSVKNQSFKDYEIVVADYNSKDKTRQLAKKYGCRIVKGGKPPIARNNGAKAAKGGILFFIDADCIMGKDFLKKSLDEIKRKNLDAAGCYVWPLGKRIVDKIAFALFNFWIYATQFFYPHAPGSGIFCKKSVHEKIRGFDEKIRLSEDMDYVRRAGKHGKFRILSSVRTYTSMRRFDSEGRFNLFSKLFFSGLHRLLFGEIKTDKFKYGFNYKK